MKRLYKFFRLSPTDQLLLIRSAALLGTIKVGLWIVPFRRMCIFLAKTKKSGNNKVQIPSERITWAVAVANHYLIAASCLPTAMTTQVLLARCGHSSHLRIGISRSEDGQLEAHAWVESCGKIVIGNLPDISRYAVLPPLML